MLFSSVSFNQSRDSQPLRAAPIKDRDFLPLTNPNLTEVEELTEPQWDEWTRGRAIRRVGFEGMKRNARLK